MLPKLQEEQQTEKLPTSPHTPSSAVGSSVESQSGPAGKNALQRPFTMTSALSEDASNLQRPPSEAAISEQPILTSHRMQITLCRLHKGTYSRCLHSGHDHHHQEREHLLCKVQQELLCSGSLYLLRGLAAAQDSILHAWACDNIPNTETDTLPAFVQESPCRGSQHASWLARCSALCRAAFSFACRGTAKAVPSGQVPLDSPSTSAHPPCCERQAFGYSSVHGRARHLPSSALMMAQSSTSCITLSCSHRHLGRILV